MPRVMPWICRRSHFDLEDRVPIKSEYVQNEDNQDYGGMEPSELAKARTLGLQAPKENLSSLSTWQYKATSQTSEDADEILVSKSIGGS